MKTLVCMLASLGIGFASPGLPPATLRDPTAEVGRLLSSAQAKLTALHSFKADINLTISRIPFVNDGPAPVRGVIVFDGNVSYLGEYPIDSHGKRINRGIVLFSKNNSEFWLNTELLSRHKTSEMEALWFIFSPSTVGRVESKVSPSEVFNRALRRGRVSNVRCLGLQTWDGVRYSVVQFEYAAQDVPIFGGNVTVTQTDFIGADGLIHRTAQQNYKWRQDSKLLHVLVNKPVPDSVFVLPKGVPGVQKHGAGSM